ncbi:MULTISPECIES: hypothetical protein [unclassified Streptomyces]|uniref:hypothetical protein n=1 Tax=unclassified Streptomyces TaxID=2593676 RepID=UPI003D7593E3
MGTSLTPEFWERLAVLLLAATGVTFVLTAVLDALALRVARRRAAQLPPTPPPPLPDARAPRPHPRAPSDRRPPVPC